MTRLHLVEADRRLQLFQQQTLSNALFVAENLSTAFDSNVVESLWIADGEVLDKIL